MPEKRILHYGLNRAGTNYLKELLEHHFQLEFLNREDLRNHPCHKHFRLYDNKQLIGRPNFYNEIIIHNYPDLEARISENGTPDLIVVISKDPYSWNLSYSRWGMKNNWEPTPHPYILEYNEFHRKWLELSRETDKIRMIRYIDLLRNGDSILKMLHDDFDLAARKRTVSELRIRKVPMSKKFTSKRLQYYLNEDYLKGYTNEELELLNGHLDHQVTLDLGYEVYGSKPNSTK